MIAASHMYCLWFPILIIVSFNVNWLWHGCTLILVSEQSNGERKEAAHKYYWHSVYVTGLLDIILEASLEMKRYWQSCSADLLDLSKSTHSRTHQLEQVALRMFNVHGLFGTVTIIIIYWDLTIIQIHPPWKNRQNSRNTTSTSRLETGAY